MTEEDYFRVFGLTSAATLAQVKETRQWYTKAFHPDRFPKGSQDQLKAEEQQKEINLAYEHLVKWFKSGGNFRKQKNGVVKEKKNATFDWHDELDEYMVFLSQSGRRDSTVQNIFCDLTLFASWIDSQRKQKFLKEDLAAMVTRYFERLSKSSYSPATVSRHMYSIRGWLLFSKIEASFILNLAALCKQDSSTAHRILTAKEVARLLASVRRRAKNEELILIEFLLHTGVTAAEVCALRWSDVSISRSSRSREVSVLLEIHGRSRVRKIPINNDAFILLTKLDFYDVLSKGGPTLNDPIFLRDGFRLTPKIIHYIVDRQGSEAGIKVSPSVLRNTKISRLVDAGVPRHHLAEYLGISEQSASSYYPSGKVTIMDLINISKI